LESFFAILECETIYIDKPKTIDTLEQQIHEYITYYNYERTQLKLRGLSLVQYISLSLA